MKHAKIFVIMLLMLFTIPMLVDTAQAQKYPKWDATDMAYRDARGEFPTGWILDYLQYVPHEIVSTIVTGGAADSEVNDYMFIAPTSLTVKSVKFTLTTVQTGAGNLPSFLLINGTDTVAYYDSLALAGSVGDVKTLTIVTAKRDFAAADKLVFRYSTPSGATVTIAGQGKLQVIWQSKNE